MPLIDTEPGHEPMVFAPIPVATGRSIEHEGETRLVDRASLVLVDESGEQHVVPLQERNGAWWMASPRQ